MNSIKILISALLLVALAAGCQEAPKPTKERLVSDLKSIHELAAKGDNMAALAHFRLPEDVSKEKAAGSMGDLIKKHEISTNGIDVLDQNGKFGKLMEVFPDKGDRWLKRSGLTEADECYALGYKNAEVAATWDGSKFLLIRLDDVGKLK